MAYRMKTGDVDLLKALLLNPDAQVGAMGSGAGAMKALGGTAIADEEDEEAGTGFENVNGFMRSKSKDAKAAMDGLDTELDADADDTTSSKMPGLDFLAKRGEKRDARAKQTAREFLGYAEGDTSESAADRARREGWKDLQAERKAAGEAPAMGVADAQAAIDKWKRFGGAKPPAWAFASAGATPGYSEADAEAGREGVRGRNQARMAADLRRRAERGDTGYSRMTYDDPITGERRTTEEPPKPLTLAEKEELMRRAAELSRKR